MSAFVLWLLKKSEIGMFFDSDDRGSRVSLLTSDDENPIQPGQNHSPCPETAEISAVPRTRIS
jgi:hypothetical protein